MIKKYQQKIRVLRNRIAQIDEKSWVAKSSNEVRRYYSEKLRIQKKIGRLNKKMRRHSCLT